MLLPIFHGISVFVPSNIETEQLVQCTVNYLHYLCTSTKELWFDSDTDVNWFP